MTAAEFKKVGEEKPNYLRSTLMTSTVLQGRRTGAGGAGVREQSEPLTLEMNSETSNR